MTQISGNLTAVRGISTSIVKSGILLFAIIAIAEGQVYPGGYPGGGYPGGGYPGGGYPGGGYPGGGYPGGGYPGGGGGGIPIPGRTKAGKPKVDANQPLPNFRGHLKQLDSKKLSLELGDNRVLDFKRTDKTKFFKGGDEIKTPKFSPGDQLSVEAQEEQSGMTAINVYWEKAAGAQTTSADEKSGAVDTWKDAPKDGSKDSAKDDKAPTLQASKDAPKDAAKDAPKDAPAARERATDAPKETAAAASSANNDRVSASSPRDPDDPGPPKLKRGRPGDQAREHASDAPQQVATNNPPPAVVRSNQPEVETLERRPTIARGNNDEDPVRLTPRVDDPLIRRAADAAMEFTESLPAYVCQEMMSRFQSESRPANFQPVDVVSTDVVYENGREDYRNIKINGRAVKKSIEETGGAWSTGEFGTILVNLFAPYTAANFHYRRDSRAGGIVSKVYDFEVAREHSGWSIHAEAQSYQPAYTGSVWIDPQTGRVLRIEMQAQSMPREFPIDHVESAVDYQYIRLGDAQQYLLPVHSESLSCQRGTDYCSRNVIDFRNYHKYSGESSIKFGGEAKEK